MLRVRNRQRVVLESKAEGDQGFFVYTDVHIEPSADVSNRESMHLFIGGARQLANQGDHLQEPGTQRPKVRSACQCELPHTAKDRVHHSKPLSTGVICHRANR